MTPLDEQLRDIAVKDWDRFVKLVGVDAIITAKACIMRQKGCTYGEISARLDKPRQTVVSIILRECKC